MSMDAFWDLPASFHTAEHVTDLVQSKVETPVTRALNFPSSASSAKFFIKADLREHPSRLIESPTSLVSHEMKGKFPQ
jgi:hypothetical protein